MKRLLRHILYSSLFRVGSVRTVFLGPCRGLRYRVFPDYGLGYCFGRWEPREMQLIGKILTAGGVAYDLGANFGMYTLFLARLVGPSGKVFAFEPLPGNITELTANVKLNGLVNVTIVPMAAARSSGMMSFVRSHSTASGHLLRGQRSEDVMQVQATSLDDFVLRDGQQPPDFIKVDVEGAEGDVLAGGLETVRRYRPAMLVELHNPEADLAVGTLLQQLGYSAIRVDTGEQVEELGSGWPNPRGIWGHVLATSRAPAIPVSN
jgi:FkbM family methyltransferase